MQWIDDMFVSMETERAAAALAKGSADRAKVNQTKHVKKQVPGALNAWTALVSSITSDVNEFNKHKERAGQTPVRMSQRRFQCEVHVPGMHAKSLVLSLDDKDLQVSVHPDFPKQPLTITVELDKEDQHGLWILGASTDKNAQLSDQQLSEYLLKPILSTAATNREAIAPLL
jgi:hypothetical protein